MVRLSRLFLILLVLGLDARLAFAADTREASAFTNAMRNFNISPELSEQDFADFVLKYQNSVRKPEAILYWAQARLYGGNAVGAIQLLTNSAGTLAPQYLYWRGRAYFQKAETQKGDKTDYMLAVDTFDDMLHKYSGAPQALDAAIWQANAFVRLEKWTNIVQLFTQTNGVFQRSVRTGGVSGTIASGYLLLGEAQLTLGDNAGVANTLRALEKQSLNTQLQWQRDYLAARLQRAEGRLEDALKTSAGLIGTSDRTNRAEGIAFQGGVQEQLGNLSEAANVYTNNLLPEVPPAQQRRAILKIAELDLTLDEKLPDAVQSLTKYLEQPQPEAADIALLTLGEVRMKQALKGDTNLFDNALAHFAKLTNSYPNSPAVGEALLYQGWCLWSQGKIAASQESFRSAADLLPFSIEQAEARFKWADTQFAARDFAAAVTNYNSIAEKYASLPEAKEHHLIERALYQSARAALNEGNLVAANSALKNIITSYPNGFAGPSALLLTGQGLVDQNDPAGARKLFAGFEERYPGNPLLPEVRLAIGRSYEAEGNWEAAMTNCTSWLGEFTNYLVPQAQFRLAYDNYMAGHETNALMLFTNFIVRFPTNELSARAQFWVGDFYFRQRDFSAAEINYQLVFQNTNWPVSELTYEARMRAARSATEQFNYKQVISYVTNLFTPDCPRELQVQATMAFADATINQDSTNKTADLNTAIGSLLTIVQTRSNTWEAADAWGRIGDCHFELGAKDPGEYVNAAIAYTNLIESPAAHGVATDEARCKLAATFEKQAAQKSGDEQARLLKLALHEYVTAFNEASAPEGASALWTKRAGTEAGRLAESLQEWTVAVNIYTELKKLLPGMAPVFDRKILKAREHL